MGTLVYKPTKKTTKSTIFTSAKEVMFCQTLFVCLSVCLLAR